MKKKLAVGLLTLVMTMSSLTGCGGSQSSSTQSGSAQASDAAEQTTDQGLDISEFVELSMYVIGDRPAGWDVNEENMNKLFKEKLNCSLTVNWIPWADYLNKYPLLFTSGEQFDMAYTATWLNYSSLAQRGAFMALDEIWPEYAPDNYAATSDSAIQQATVQGHIYCIPSQNATYNSQGVIYRGDILAEAGMDPIEDLEDLEAYCDYVKEAYPEMEPLDISSNGGSTYDMLYLAQKGYVSINNSGVNEFLFYNVEEEHPTLKTIYEIDGVTDFLEMMARWNEKGFYSKSALADTDTTKFENGKSAVKVYNLDNYRSYAIQHPEWDIQFANLYKDVAHLPYTQDALVIPTTAQHPERALALWNLITTDQEAYDAFMYGVEGTTYELNESGQYKILDTDLYAENNCWAARTTELNRNPMGTPEGYDATKQAFEEMIAEDGSAEKYTSFVIDTSLIEVEYAACQSVNQQYWWPLELGYTDITTGLAEYQEKLEAAGLETVRAELQRQLDEYLTTID